MAASFSTQHTGLCMKALDYYFIIKSSIKFSLPFIRLGYGYGLGYGLGHPALDLALAAGAVGPVIPVGVGVLPHPLLLRK